ncbi:hypothetical protein RSP03_41250 [Cereibacter sphaeroides]|nr:hypothetical protein RSP03_41250 [Cereibacter sphaeroides]
MRQGNGRLRRRLRHSRQRGCDRPEKEHQSDQGRWQGHGNAFGRGFGTELVTCPALAKGRAEALLRRGMILPSFCPLQASASFAKCPFHDDP